MALAVVFRRIAQIELDEAGSWYENKRVGVGKKLGSRLKSALNR
jgi:hypothetical protein